MLISQAITVNYPPQTMTAKTAALLYHLLWHVDMLTRPNLRKIDESFERWAYRQGIWQQLERLRKRELLERSAECEGKHAYRLSEKGRILALGGRDPLAQWNRPWDGKWRLVIFDVPEKRNPARQRLRFLLRRHWFGCLQRSCWITPDPLDKIAAGLRTFAGAVKSLLTIEGQPGCGELPNAIAVAAWDFEEINQRYEECLRVLRQFPGEEAAKEAGQEQLRRWARKERVTWLAAVSHDPLLPAALLPADYLGKRVWQTRAEILNRAAKCI